MTTDEIIKEILQNDFLVTMIFRFAIVIVTISVVRIFIPFYKYSLRLASFYESRANSIILSGISDLDRVKTFADVMATEKIDFEKDDALSIQDWVNLIKGKKD